MFVCISQVHKSVSAAGKVKRLGLAFGQPLWGHLWLAKARSSLPSPLELRNSTISVSTVLPWWYHHLWCHPHITKYVLQVKSCS